MIQGHLIDTNVIIRYPSALQNFTNPIVHLKTIEEIDRLKDSDNFELSYRARKGAKYIEHCLENIIIENKNYRKKDVDDILLECAKKKNYILVTNDLTLRLKCKFNNVESTPYKNGDASIYTGVRTYLIKHENEISSVLESLEDLHENEFIIFKNILNTIKKPNGDLDHEPIKEFVYRDGEIVLVPEKTFSNLFYRKLQSRNAEQKCLMYALDDSTITVICASGTYGTGKTILTVNYALEQLEKGFINKIIYVPNNASTAHSREVAALPGNLLEKEIPYMGSLLDIIGIEETERRIEDGTLELMPISLARGRNIENAIVLVGEAQNLTEEHVKLLIGRVGENTKIIFDGDVNQTDKPTFRNSNGLKLLYKIKDSDFSHLFASVKLETIERSETAMISEYLDNID